MIPLLDRGGARLRESLRNAGFSSLDFLLRPLLFVLATPVLVAGLGTAEYGLWILALSVAGLSGLASFGVGDATVRFVARYRALDDPAGAARVVRSTLGVALVLGAVAALVVIVCAPLLVGLVVDTEGQDAVATAAIRIAGLGIAVQFVGAVFQSALHGYERYDLAATPSMVAGALTVVVHVLLVLAGLGVVALMLAWLALIAADAVAKAVLVKRTLLPGLRPVPSFDRSALREVLGYGFYSWLQGVGGTLWAHLDKFIVASLLGPAALTYYAVCLQLTTLIHGLGARAIGFIFPLSSTLYERGDAERLRRLYFHGQNAASVLAVALSLPVFLFAPQILTVWLGAGFAAVGSDVLRILALAFAFLATSTVPYYFMNGTAFVRLNTAFSLMSGAIVAVAAVLLVPWLGLVGAAWARLVGVPAALVARTILHRRVLRDFRWYGSLATLLPVGVAFALAAPIALAGGDPEGAVPVWVLWAILAGAAGGLLAWSIGRALNRSALTLEATP